MFQIRSKYVHDLKESDGSPSKHDGKDASLIATCIANGKGERWDLPIRDNRITKMEYLLKRQRYNKKLFQQKIGHMESELARVWGSWSNELIPFYSPTTLKYLQKRGGPPSGSPEEIKQEIRQEFSALHSDEKMEVLIKSGQKPCGIAMNEESRNFLRELATEMIELLKTNARLEKQLEEISFQTDLVPDQLVKVLGKTAATLITVILGDPRKYHCAEAFLKALGLNLVENSSGGYKGQVSISKRGNPEIRRVLYLATLRLIQQPEIAPWYAKKKLGRRGKNGGDCSLPAVIAVMRKVVIGLYHAIQDGVPFDGSKLFRVKEEDQRSHVPKKQVKALSGVSQEESKEKIKTARPFQEWNSKKRVRSSSQNISGLSSPRSQVLLE